MPEKRITLRVCQQCGKEFLAPTIIVEYGNARFCSRKCGVASRRKPLIPRICQHCGKEFLAPMKNINRDGAKYCSQHCYGLSRDVGSEWKSTTGYMYQRLPGQKVRRKSRIVMEQVLGRPLEKWEAVHHRNHIRDDDRPENLQVVTYTEHARIHAAEIGWSKLHAACIECGTTETFHKGCGLCANCFARRRRRIASLRADPPPADC